MYGLFPALMETERLQDSRRQRADELSMRQRQLAMQEQSHGLSVQEAQMRVAAQRRQQQAADDLVGAIDADGAPSPQTAPGLMPPANGMAPQANQAFMEANGVEPVSAPPAAGLQRPGASKFDVAAMRAAAASGNVKGVYDVKDRVKGEALESGRKGEFKRLMGQSEQDLVAAFAPMNAHPGFKGMLNFDPKSRKFLLVSEIPGLETQSMTKEELVNSMMGIWEAGNGDFNAGMNRMMQGAQRRREIDNSNYDRSGKLAGMNADAHFKGADDDRAAAQAAEQRRHNRATEGNAAAGLGLQRDRARMEDWAIVGATEDNKGLMRFNRRTGQTEVQPLPPGTDAGGMFRKITGQRGTQMSGLEQAQAYKAYIEGGMDPVEAQARVSGVDIGAMVADSVRKRAEAKAAPRAGVQSSASTPPTDPIQIADSRVLQRLAAIPGHTMQRAAQAELERREANQPDTSQYGAAMAP